MKRDSDKLVNSIDGNTYVEIGTKGHKDAGNEAYDWSMVMVRNQSPLVYSQ